MADETTDEPTIALRVDWSDAEDMPALAANEVLTQATREEIFLTFGQITPPIFLGTPEEKARQAEERESLRVKVVSRVTITPTKLAEFIEVLGRALQNYERQVAAAAKQEGGDEDAGA